MSDMETELKNLIVTHLMLEDVTADEIDSNAPIFGDGLGLDSIDALELALAINKVYGVKIKADDERNQRSSAPCGRWPRSSPKTGGPRAPDDAR